MKIIVSKTAGFCFGVKRAVNLAFGADGQKKTYTLGEIIHNDHVINQLEEQGIKAIEEKELVDKNMERLIIRAHGVGKSVYDQTKMREIELIDATCPYVRKIHKIVKKHSEQQKGIIIIGDERHPEIIGIKGWVNGFCHIIKDSHHMKLEVLPKQYQYIVVAQTTYKKEVVMQVLEELSAKGYEVEYLSTICNATTERQEDAEKISKQVDAMIVIGSPSSSNTQKLYEICSKNCKYTWCINTPDELDLKQLKNKEYVGITAGASTPEDLISEVIRRINGHQEN